jgi:hypothetical protein
VKQRVQKRWGGLPHSGKSTHRPQS